MEGTCRWDLFLTYDNEHLREWFKNQLNPSDLKECVELSKELKGSAFKSITTYPDIAELLNRQLKPVSKTQQAMIDHLSLSIWSFHPGNVASGTTVTAIFLPNASLKMVWPRPSKIINNVKIDGYHTKQNHPFILVPSDGESVTGMVALFTKDEFLQHQDKMINAHFPLQIRLKEASITSIDLVRVWIHSPTAWYFAYGPRFRLEFKKVTKTGHGAATIQPDSDSEVIGVAYALSPAKFPRMDRIEGVPEHYRRIIVNINIDFNAKTYSIKANSYIATSPNTTVVAPSEKYLNAILSCALPKDYKKKLLLNSGFSTNLGEAENYLETLSKKNNWYDDIDACHNLQHLK